MWAALASTATTTARAGASIDRFLERPIATRTIQRVTSTTRAGSVALPRPTAYAKRCHTPQPRDENNDPTLWCATNVLLPLPEPVLRGGDLGVEGEPDRRTPARGGAERSDDRPWPGQSPSAPGVNGEGDPNPGDHRGQGGRAEERGHRGDRQDGELPATRRTPSQLPCGQHGAREQDVELVLLHPGGVDDAQRCCRDRGRGRGARPGGRNGNSGPVRRRRESRRRRPRTKASGPRSWSRGSARAPCDR